MVPIVVSNTTCSCLSVISWLNCARWEKQTHRLEYSRKFSGRRLGSLVGVAGNCLFSVAPQFVIRPMNQWPGFKQDCKNKLIFICIDSHLKSTSSGRFQANSATRAISRPWTFWIDYVDRCGAAHLLWNMEDQEWTKKVGVRAVAPLYLTIEGIESCNTTLRRRRCTSTCSPSCRQSLIGLYLLSVTSTHHHHDRCLLYTIETDTFGNRTVIFSC